MSFTSLTFVGFLLIVLALYWLARRQTWQNIILLAASYIFYGWLNPWYGILLGLSSTADFFIALGISRYRAHSRALLTLSLLLNLGVLAFFKYYNFFNAGLVAQLAKVGVHADVFLVSILLPAGLSFYTLRKLAYILDVSRGTFQPVENFVDFSLYVSFFPQIIAGPIERIQKLMPQIQSPRIWKPEFFSAAWPLLVMGLFKKVVVADTISPIVDRIFNMQGPSKTLALVAVLGFTLQILADFSGYTDMARGIALLFGFETSENFHQPYLALTPSDFWNRWHITLSNFLRDYIFFPLRRALLKKRTLRQAQGKLLQEAQGSAWLAQAVPPLATMFVSGLWHGAGWTYLIWGIYYGVLIVIYQSSGIQVNWNQSNKLKLLVAWLVMFSLIVFGWFLFRASSIAWAGKVLFQAAWLAKPQDAIIALMMLSMTMAYSLPLILKMFLDRFSKPGSWQQAAYFALITLVTIVYINSSNPDFIYFQF